MLVWLCLSVCWATVYSECINRLGLNEGEICKLAAGSSWTCKNVKDCPRTAKALQDGDKGAQICGLTPTLDLTVCCEPEGGIGAKSREMCKKYAESVFIRVPDVLGDGEIISYDTCGRGKPTPSRTKRVIDGIESQSREYPHMALLGYGNKTAPKWLCGGTLISERFVLTTASCATGGPIFQTPKIVRLGDLNIHSESDEDESVSQPSEYEVEAAINHPDFKSSVKYNDIALLKLNKDVFFTEFIRPICLQTEHRLPTTYGLATGWGSTGFTGKASSTLLTANVTFFTQDECYATYEKNTRSLKDGISESTMVCAGDKEGNRDTCQGDAGGPLQIPVEEPYCMYSQVGITSFGKACGISSVPGVYTRISHYIPWIERIVWP